jgi:hypothetical protein
MTGRHQDPARVREAFFAAADAARAVLADERVARGWDGPSCLREFSLRGLAGHVVRAVTSVEAYLDRPVPSGEGVVSAAEYYARAVDEPDIASALHVAVRERGEEQAAEGHVRLVAEFDGMLARLRNRLVDQPPDRLMRVFRDLVIMLDEYLRTRIVELVVHTDDLACSIGDHDAKVPPEPAALAIATLVDVARYRHGDVAVLRALARRERDAVQALRVL